MTYGELMNENPTGTGLLSLADSTTYALTPTASFLAVRPASADILLKVREDRDDKIIIVNAEKATFGSRQSVLDNYHKYELNHARKGPFFPVCRHDSQASRSRYVPYRRKEGRRALRNLRVEIGRPSHLSGDLPGHEHGDDMQFRRDLPDRFIRLGDVSANLGAPAHRWTGGDRWHARRSPLNPQESARPPSRATVKAGKGRVRVFRAIGIGSRLWPVASRWSPGHRRRHEPTEQG